MRRFGPSGLVLRVRWLFLLLNALVVVILLLAIPGSGTSTSDSLLSMLALVAILGWSLLRYRFTTVPAVIDLIPVGAIFLLGISASSPDAAFGPAFVLVCYRAQFGTTNEASLNAVAYFGAFLLPYVVLADHLDAVDLVGSALVLVFFLVVSKVMHGFVVSARRHETTLERERRLAEGSTALLAAESEEQIVDRAVRTLTGLSSEPCRIACPRVDTFGDIDLQPPGDPSPFREALAWVGALPTDERRLAMRTQTMLQPPPPGGPARRRNRWPRAATRPAFVALPVGAADEPAALAVIVTTHRRDLDEVAAPISRFLDEVRLTVDRARLHDELRRASASKDLFLSMVSHELRTPLTVVRGAFETLLARGDSIPVATRKELLELGRRQAERQERLVDDLLLTTRLLASRLPVKPEQIDLLAVVGEVADTLELGERLVMHVEHATGWPAWADPHHAVQIVTNLLTNALKYGAPPIEVTAQQHDTDLLLDVRDHGPGISPKDAVRIFDPFEQARSGEQAGPGVGLGLAIGRQLAQANSGGLDIVSIEGTGACFRVRLPTGRAGRNAAG